ncbi:MAG: glycine cleavage system aminomethyltransferase GcvT [Candidatus Thorarchaeota archaeon]|nr:MAG: glycine cleavage system aminomethyltransferase GcvT [Candidatus Thorarchaeota archaeon]
MNETLRRTHLFSWHEKHGDIVPFAGWAMPVRFTNIREEHIAVRESVGIFDITNMYRFLIRGPQAAQFLQTVTTNNVSKLKVSGGHYTTCLNEQGGIHDDLMLYRIAEHEYIWITNASNGPKITQHLLTEAANFEVEVEDKTSEITMVAVQGPKAFSLLSKLAGIDVSGFPRFSCNLVKLAGYNCYLCRTGYTGEAGAEILLLNTPFNDEGKSRAVAFWEELLKQGAEYGVKPCGLGARDSTRLEAGFVLYGHELEEDITPIEARIRYAVKFKVEPHYIGYAVLKKQKEEGVEKTRIGLIMIDRGVPRQHYNVLLNSNKIGQISSGGISPLLKKGIGLAFVTPGMVNEGDTIEIDIKGRLRKARVSKWPFFDSERYGENRTK